MSGIGERILDFGFWILDYAPSTKPEAQRSKSKIQNPKSKILTSTRPGLAGRGAA
jgi:hypothetical protein